MPDSTKRPRPKRVLIAQLSTIPHYRVRFYELLEERRPKDWEFDVVFDCRESEKPRVYAEPVDYRSFKFPYVDTRTTIVSLGKRKLLWQHFVLLAGKYDAIITDTHMTNISYPLTALWQLVGKKRGYWGHIRNMNEPVETAAKGAGQKLKLLLVKHSDMFFSYTVGMSREAVQLGVPENRVVTVGNSIDTKNEREAYLQTFQQRDELRRGYAVQDKQVLLYVGRLHKNKRIDYLLDAFELLLERSPSAYHLFVVGTGESENLVIEKRCKLGPEAITHFGALVDTEKLAPIFTSSDLYVLPGAVGLGPLQAQCYNLPVVAFDVKTHGPEYEYLSPENSVVLPWNLSASEFADMIPQLVSSWKTEDSRLRIYPSIRHLSLEQMADNFAAGIQQMFG